MYLSPSAIPPEPLPAVARSPGRYGFPPDTQLSALARYLPIKEHLGDAALASLLEVGSGVRGLSCVLPGGGGGVAARFVGIDTRLAGTPAPSMIPFAYEGGRLPFRDGAFHTVVSMNTVEHIPPARRRWFIGELARVSSARLILGFPVVGETGGDGLRGEGPLQELLRALGVGDPDWLHESDARELPCATDVEEILSELDGRSWRRLATTSSLVSLMAVLVDVLPGTRSWLAPLLDSHGPALEAWLRAGMFGPSDRAAYLIERRHPTAPLVSLTSAAVAGAASPPGPSASLARGLVCPDCEGGLQEPASLAPSSSPSPSSGLTCTGCQRSFPRDARGVIALARSEGPVTFRLAPRWLSGEDWVPAVHNYLQTFGASDPCVLWLDVDPAQLSLTEALQLLRPVLAPFGDRTFAEIFMNDEPAGRPQRGRVVPLPADSKGLQGCGGEWFRAHVGGADAGADAGVGLGDRMTGHGR